MSSGKNEGVGTKHQAFLASIRQWVKCRDTFEGSDAVKAAGVRYLPMLSGQDKQEYEAYKARALFYSIVSKATSAMAGMVVTKAPVIKYPESMVGYFKDHTGIQVGEVIVKTIMELVLVGRIGALLDRPADGGPARVVLYMAESIINWKLDSSGKPVLVVLEEITSVDVDGSEFETAQVTQYRVLRIRDGEYTQAVYSEKGEIVSAEFAPTNFGNTMDFIPFFVVNPSGVSFNVEKSPSIDIVDINISHYMTSADLEHGRHFTALPTPVIIGADTSTVLKIGSSTAWVIPDVRGNAKYLEYTGQGLSSLEKALVEKQSQIASLSARMLDNSKRGSENADTVRLRYVSEGANLITIVKSAQTFLSILYKTVALMEDENPDDILVELDTGFLNSRLSPSEVKSLVDSYISGGLSEQTLVYNLRRGDIISPDREDKDELSELINNKSVGE